jgi:hypothetical protein
LMLASGEGTVKLGILGREKNYCAQGGTDVKQFTIGENLMITTRTTAVSVCSQLGPKRLFGFNEKITISIEDTVHGALTDAETTITEKYSTLAKCNSELHRADVEFTHP